MQTTCTVLQSVDDITTGCRIPELDQSTSFRFNRQGIVLQGYNEDIVCNSLLLKSKKVTEKQREVTENDNN